MCFFSSNFFCLFFVGYIFISVVSWFRGASRSVFVCRRFRMSFSMCSFGKVWVFSMLFWVMFAG